MTSKRTLRRERALDRMQRQHEFDQIGGHSIAFKRDKPGTPRTAEQRGAEVATLERRIATGRT